MTKVIKTGEDKITKFVNSWTSILILSLVIISVALIQLIVFAFFNGTISGFKVTDDNAWIAWIYLLISIPFGLASVIGMIYSIRGSSNFLFYAFIVEIGYFASGLAGGMMFSALIMGILMWINITRYYYVKKYGEDYSINEKIVETIMWIMVIAILILGIVSIELDNDNVFWWNTNVYGNSKVIPYIDVVTTAFTFAGVMLMLSKNKYAYIAFIICDVLFVILFSNAHQWSNLAVTIIFIITECLGFIVWHRRD